MKASYGTGMANSNEGRKIECHFDANLSISIRLCLRCQAQNSVRFLAFKCQEPCMYSYP